MSHRIIKVKDKDLYLNISDEIDDFISNTPQIFDDNDCPSEILRDLQISNIPIDGYLPSNMEIKEIIWRS